MDLSAATSPSLPIAAGVLLRPLKAEDVTERYVSLLNDAAVSKFLVSARSGAYTFEGVKRMVSENFAAPDAILFGLFVSDQHCGNVRLHDIRDGSAFVGIAIFDDAAQGRGLGALALRAVARYARSELALVSILAGIDDRNLGSMKAFAKAGFVEFAKSSDSNGWIWKLDTAGLGAV